jgi:energy-coupling factor transport system substrate-specific component
MNNKTMWQFGTREVVYAAIGAALYGVLSWVFNNIQIPGLGLVSFRPPVAIPFFMGIVFGPLVGFFTGFVGNILGDLLSGYGFFWGWDVGNGLMGLVAGLVPVLMNKDASKDYVWAAITAVIASFVGMAFPTLISDPFIDRSAEFMASLTTTYPGVSLTNAVNGAILTPLLLYAWNSYRARSGR